MTCATVSREYPQRATWLVCATLLALSLGIYDHKIGAGVWVAFVPHVAKFGLTGALFGGVAAIALVGAGAIGLFAGVRLWTVALASFAAYAAIYMLVVTLGDYPAETFRFMVAPVGSGLLPLLAILHVAVLLRMLTGKTVCHEPSCPDSRVPLCSLAIGVVGYVVTSSYDDSLKGILYYGAMIHLLLLTPLLYIVVALLWREFAIGSPGLSTRLASLTVAVLVTTVLLASL